MVRRRKKLTFKSLTYSIQNDLRRRARQVKYYEDGSTKSNQWIERYEQTGFGETLGLSRALISLYQGVRSDLASRNLNARLKYLAKVHGFAEIDYKSFPKLIRDALPLSVQKTFLDE